MSISVCIRLTISSLCILLKSLFDMNWHSELGARMMKLASQLGSQSLVEGRKAKENRKRDQKRKEAIGSGAKTANEAEKAERKR